MSDNLNPPLMSKEEECHKLQKKILYWGMYGSGKTTAVNTIYKLSQEQELDIKPIGELTKIERASGATLYFDRGIFQSTRNQEVFYHIFTVAGQKSFETLRKKIYQGTDGVIFVFDSQTHLIEDNIESLKELKNLTGDNLIKKIPFIVMANKQDLNNVVNGDRVKSILEEENLWYKTNESLNMWNPIIYNTCGLYNQRKNIYRSFSEVARRIGLYSLYGNGKAPVSEKFVKFASNEKLLL